MESSSFILRSSLWLSLTGPGHLLLSLRCSCGLWAEPDRLMQEVNIAHSQVFISRHVQTPFVWSFLSNIDTTFNFIIMGHSVGFMVLCFDLVVRDSGRVNLMNCFCGWLGGQSLIHHWLSSLKSLIPWY